MSLEIMNFTLNYIDWIILIIGVYFILDGWQNGFISLLTTTGVNLVSLFLSLRYSSIVANLIYTRIGLGLIWSQMASFLLIVVLTNIFLGISLKVLLKPFHRHLIKNKLDNIFGALLNIVNGLIFVTIILLILISLPGISKYRPDIKDSFFATRILNGIKQHAGGLEEYINQLTNQALRFVTIKPSTRDSITLNLDLSNIELTDDKTSENKMVELVNDDRIRKGIVPLTVDPQLTQLARWRSRDMLMNNYFSHINKKGQDVADIAQEQAILFDVIGENIAFAADVNLAYKGLFDSPGHRKNILDPGFSHIGIGVVNAGIYGRMITQVFVTKPFYIRNR